MIFKLQRVYVNLETMQVEFSGLKHKQYCFSRDGHSQNPVRTEAHKVSTVQSAHSVANWQLGGFSLPSEEQKLFLCHPKSICILDACYQNIVCWPRNQSTLGNSLAVNERDHLHTHCAWRRLYICFFTVLYIIHTYSGPQTSRFL